MPFHQPHPALHLKCVYIYIDFIENGIFPVEIQMKTDFLGNSLRRGGGTPSDCCHTDSNASTTAGGGGGGPNGGNGGGVGNQMQQQNTPMTHVSFAEDDSSCDSHTRWGKRVIFFVFLIRDFARVLFARPIFFSRCIFCIDAQQFQHRI